MVYTKSFPQKRFSHYVVFRGLEAGVFHNYSRVRESINCLNASWQGFHSFKEALDEARKAFFPDLNFYIEPEKVKSFSQVASESPSELISAQAEVIKNLEKQVADLQSHLFISNSKIQEIEGILESKNKKILTMEKEVLSLNSKIFSQKEKIQKLKKEEKILPSKNFGNLKARILDLPYTEALKPKIYGFYILEI